MDSQHVRALLQLLNPTHPPHETIAIDVHGNGGKHRDLEIFAWENASDRLTAIEPAALISRDDHRGLKERERIGARHGREDLKCKEYQEHHEPHHAAASGARRGVSTGNGCNATTASWTRCASAT